MKKFEEQKPTEDGAAPPSKYYSMNFKYATWKAWIWHVESMTWLEFGEPVAFEGHDRHSPGICHGMIYEVRCTLSYRLNSLDSKNLTGKHHTRSNSRKIIKS